jgi:hypothetical protein
MPNIDQLVSPGEWRIEIDVERVGMQRNSDTNQGKSFLEVEELGFLSGKVAVAYALSN